MDYQTDGNTFSFIKGRSVGWSKIQNDKTEMLSWAWVGVGYSSESLICLSTNCRMNHQKWNIAKLKILLYCICICICVCNFTLQPEDLQTRGLQQQRLILGRTPKSIDHHHHSWSSWGWWWWWWWWWWWKSENPKINTRIMESFCKNDKGEANETPWTQIRPGSKYQVR